MGFLIVVCGAISITEIALVITGRGGVLPPPIFNRIWNAAVVLVYIRITIWLLRRFHDANRQASAHYRSGTIIGTNPGYAPVRTYYGTLRASGNSPLSGEGACARVTTEPLKAWKAALLQQRDGRGIVLRAVTWDHFHKPEDQAICKKDVEANRNPEHSAPQLDCTCGFYGRPYHVDVDQAKEFTVGTVRLDVEFYGKVIEHQFGYRAEHQRILKLWLPANCAICHGLSGTLSFISNSAATLCKSCIDEHKEDVGLVAFSATDISNALGGIEVGFDENGSY